jgi:uncharacterized lipoprotein YmbA
METKSFSLRVGDFCANGAQVLAVYMNELEGVVLATWKQEFITWVFPTNNQQGTAHGNYFMYDLNKGGDEWDAFQRAQADFLARVAKQIREF